MTAPPIATFAVEYARLVRLYVPVLKDAEHWGVLQALQTMSNPYTPAIWDDMAGCDDNEYMITHSLLKSLMGLKGVPVNTRTLQDVAQFLGAAEVQWCMRRGFARYMLDLGQHADIGAEYAEFEMAVTERMDRWLQAGRK